jgi:hypothetical protein
LTFYLESLCPPVSTKTGGQTKNTVPASLTLKMSDWRAKTTIKNFARQFNRKLFCPPDDPLPIFWRNGIWQHHETNNWRTYNFIPQLPVD